MRKILCVLLATASLSFAGVPRGYKPVEKFEAAKAEAVEKKKLLAILVKGNNDSCPNCVTTVENANRAIKSSCMMLFMRVGEKTDLPAEITDHFKGLPGGASVSYFVFNPTTLELVAKGNRSTLQSDKKAIRAFKNTVRKAKMAL